MDKAIVIASGPSLTQEDAKLAMASGWPVIAVNSSWRMVPGCDVIYAGDIEWWTANHNRIDSSAERWTCHVLAAQRYHLKLHHASGPYNSGMRAIQFAASKGASRIVLLGFDCCTDADTHWHGDHPDGLRNPDAGSPAKWQQHFERLRPLMAHTDIINCSRRTRLTQFRRSDLTGALRPSGSF